jgi:DNA-binding NarL/FixJ family response regulator
MRAGLHTLLNEFGRGTISVVGEADSIEITLDWMHATQPQVVLFDVALDLDDELSGLWRLRAYAPNVAVLALVESRAPARMAQALRAGAHGGLPKTASGPELLEAVLSLAQGTPRLRTSLTTPPPPPALVENLTPREAEVVRAVATGQTNKAIAIALGISEHTVKFHLGSAMSKLGAASRAEAVAIAMRQGLIAV